MTTARTLAGLLAAVALVAVPAAPTAAQSPDPPPVETVVDGLTTPWALAFTPDGRTFLTERDTGIVRELADGAAREVHRFDVDPAGEGGLLGLAVSPDWQQDGWLYAYLTTPGDNRIVRFRPDSGEVEALLTGIPAGTIHNGGRIAFGPDGLLYAGTGDAGVGERAQDPGSLAGKILRIGPDGSIPAANPFGSPVLSYGHRNVQGLAWDAAGRMFATEFGPDRDDEINRIGARGNYGWPAVTGVADDPDFVDPVLVRQPPEASWSGAAVLTRDGIPGWQGDLLATGLRGERLWRVDLEDGAVVGAEALYTGRFGRLREVVEAPDGAVWLVTGNYGGDDRLLRIAPTRDPRIEQACPPGEVDDAGFTDVPPGSVHDAAIDCVAHHGIAAGVDGRRYAPARAVSRAQLASLTARTLSVAGADLPAPEGGRFDDVDPAGPHADAIDRLAQLGVMTGRGGDRFAPGLPVSRAQAASVLVRAYAELAGEPLPAGDDAFTDDDGSVHEPSIDRAAEAGIVAGRGGDRYLPGVAVRRDQAAALIARTLDVAVERAGADPQPR